MNKAYLPTFFSLSPKLTSSYFHVICISVWSDDNWLKKHAGATLKEQEEAAQAEESAKRPAEDTDEVN